MKFFFILHETIRLILPKCTVNLFPSIGIQSKSFSASHSVFVNVSRPFIISIKRRSIGNKDLRADSNLLFTSARATSSGVFEPWVEVILDEISHAPPLWIVVTVVERWLIQVIWDV